MNKIIIPLIFMLFSMPVYSLPYDYSSVKRVPIKLSIVEEISTKMPIIEGQQVQFKVLSDVWYDNKPVVKSGDIVNAKLETIITSGMNGFPAEIIVDEFEIPGIRESQMISMYNKKGQNRCIWVFPLKWALTFLPPTGSLTNLIKGGHARIKTSDVVTIYYYPKWL